MPALSVAMIVKNEAHCLRECLDSVRAIADEIVICDTGSTDDTISIARSVGARVIEIPWENDFARARNQSLAAATKDWILHLDADEAVDPSSAQRIRDVVNADGASVDGASVDGASVDGASAAGKPRADAIEVTLANYSNDMRAWRWVPAKPGDPMARGYAGYIRVGLLRLFRNGLGFEYREAVHENITESVVEHGGLVRIEPIVIHHYGYEVDAPRARQKAQVYLDIAREKVRQRSDDPKAWHDLAEQSLACGDAQAAENAARRALALSPLHLDAATTLANLLLNRGDLDAAYDLLSGLESAGIAPPHVVTALGAIACKRGNLDEAARRLSQLTVAHPETIQPYLYLARVLDRRGDAAGARQCLVRAHAIAPSLNELRDRLAAHELRCRAESEFAQGNSRVALERLVEALRLDAEDPLIQNDIGVVLLALGQRDKARQAFERALRLAPGMPEARDNLAALAAH